MAFLRWYYFCALLVGFELGLANGQYYRQVGSKKLPYQTFTVDQSGHANFSTVQSAVNAVPSNNKYWICIRVKAGTYRYNFCFTFLLLFMFEAPFGVHDFKTCDFLKKKRLRFENAAACFTSSNRNFFKNVSIYLYINKNIVSCTIFLACACREKVIIPYDKQYIILKGEGRRKTWIEWDDHDNVAQSPTFISQADNFVAKSISFRVRIC